MEEQQQEEQPYYVKLTRTQLELMHQGLNDARLSCSITDCFSCCEYGEMQRRIAKALSATA